MKRYFCIAMTLVSVLLTFANPCPADHGYSHGSDWNDWAAALSLGILGTGVWLEMTRPQYPPPQLYMQPLPDETIKPGFMYYCVYSSGYYPYMKGCPGGWLMVVPIPEPPQK